MNWCHRIADLVLKVVAYMGKALRRGGKKESVDATALGGVAGAVDRIGALHEKRRLVDVAEGLWVCEISYSTPSIFIGNANIGELQDQMVLPFSHEEGVVNEDDWEQFIRWEMCEEEQEGNESNGCIDPRLLTIG